MARRPNYGFEKRQKELEKQKKKDEKAEKKRLRKEAGTDEYGNSLYVDPDEIGTEEEDEGEPESGTEGEEGAEGGERDDDTAAG
jgi:CRISPR/Cas system-associated protein Cas7 (RAMP superfamily)